MRKGKKFHNSFWADRLRIPVDVSRGEIKLTITGNRRLWIENYLGILSFTAESVILQGREKNVIIEGKGLILEYFTDEDLLILGELMIIRYDGKERGN